MWGEERWSIRIGIGRERGRVSFCVGHAFFLPHCFDMFILYADVFSWVDHLITDEKELSQTAFDRGSLGRLAALVKAITPIPSSTSSTNGNGHGVDNGEVNTSGLGMGISSIGSGLGMGTSVGSGLGTFGSIGSMHTSATDGALAGNGAGNGVTGMGEGEGWEEEEAESIGRLREVRRSCCLFRLPLGPSFPKTISAEFIQRLTFMSRFWWIRQRSRRFQLSR